MNLTIGFLSAIIANSIYKFLEVTMGVDKRQAAKLAIRRQMIEDGKTPSSEDCPRCRMPMEHRDKGKKREVCNFCWRKI